MLGAKGYVPQNTSKNIVLENLEQSLMKKWKGGENNGMGFIKL